MTDATMPEVIKARPMMGAVGANSGPWAIDDPYHNATDFYRGDLYDTQTARIAEIEALIAKIEAGECPFWEVDAALGYVDAKHAEGAFLGSLDAAKALHEAVLPKMSQFSIVTDPILGHDTKQMAAHYSKSADLARVISGTKSANFETEVQTIVKKN